MSRGLETTFELLAATRNEAAVHVLVPALDSPYPAIRHGAVRALLARRSHTGQREIVARLHLLDGPSRHLVQQRPGRITAAVRDALVASEPQTVANGFMAVLWLREYDLTSTLVSALEDAQNPHADGAGRTLLELADLLYGELCGHRDRRTRRDPHLVRKRVVDCLERSAARYHQHKRSEIVEAFMRLAPHGNKTLKRVLHDPHDRNFVAFTQTLAKSEHAGVMRLLLGFLDDPGASKAALHVVGHRTDVKFLRHLFDKVIREPTDAMHQNLKRIDSIAWVGTENQAVLDLLDEPQQEAAVRLVVASGIKRLEAFEVVASILGEGKPAGRRAAAEALVSFSGAEANALVLEALEDEDPWVQAHAVRQLRRRGLPGAFQRQVSRLDSPHEVVREAARQSLSEFTFPRFLATFDTLDEEVRRRTGRLVKKVDPRATGLLVEELASPSRMRRLRALSMIEAMDAVRETEWAVIERLEDKDHVIRVEAARILANCPTRAAETALRKALTDSSVLVQQAAEQSLIALAPASAPPPPAGFPSAPEHVP